MPARAGGHAVLTDQLLVAPVRDNATQVEADGVGIHTAAPMYAGFAILTVPLGAEVTLHVLDANGKTLATQPLREPASGERIFNERLTFDW
ncbi:hypothetical protein [Micromonospora sp. NPDC005806]|uniref:hypothetical protein n=1 Tax=Micromonospora sp. NPDC005806 TaxID=3364234 RepID=UPI0036AE24CA